MKKSFYEFKSDDAFRFATEQGLKYKMRGDELQLSDCPYCHGANHGDKYKFSINLNSGAFKCLRASCGAKGNMITLSKDFDFSLGEEVDEYFKGLKQFKRLVQVKTESKPKAIEYMLSRRISEETTRKYGITSKPDNENILIFPFYDEKDRLQFVKYRNTAYQKGDNGSKEWCEADCKPILFGMSQCNFDNKTLIMTEGQIDSLSVSECGFENAVSVPMGKNGFTWVRYCWDFLGKFDTLIVFGDYERDEITLLNEMKKRFNGAVKYVQPEDYKDCKDANDILRKYGKDQIKTCINNAIPVPVEMVIDMSEVAEIDPFKVEKLKTGIKELDDKLHGGLTFGNVHVVGGKRGDGKSTFASQIIASALRQNYTCFMYSGELPNSNVRSWLDSQIAGTDNVVINYEADGTTPKNWFLTNTTRDLIGKWYKGRCLLYDGDSIMTEEHEDLLETVEKVIQRNSARVILLDNLMTGLDLVTKQNTETYEKQSWFTKRLAQMAKRYGACILLVAHRRKSNKNFSDDVNDEISGSGDITNLAGTVVSYDRLTDKDLQKAGFEEATKQDRKLIIAKDRLFGNVDYDGILLHYDKFSKRVYSDSDNPKESYGWDTSESADDGFMQVVDDEVNPFL